ncbi:hypothetical protein C0J52_25346, partial [Blattella germanica]
SVRQDHHETAYEDGLKIYPKLVGNITFYPGFYEDFNVYLKHILMCFLIKRNTKNII